MWFSKQISAPEPKQPFFAWSSEEHSVGIRVFDQEHQRLVALMSQVHIALMEKHDRTLALERLEFLIAQARSHFDHEEGVMGNIEFAERDAHMAEHTALIEQANALLQKVQNGSLSALAISAFLKDWLSHMQILDRKYVATMRRHGLR
ncbi:MAG: hemerythrin family protein [Holophagaceae bacterium]|uniref:Hemerythrin family protein n=1 Tax=Candidatus Geothrix skivensis TaxID=2954439 RepID=A0A9D7SGT5_9BACT|nr:hemerythrin family protein [Candidatus Geothrix skivensis]